MSFYRHPQSLVESTSIGKGTRIWAFSHIQPDVEMGNDCNIGEHCFVESGVRMGNRVTIKNGVCLWKGLVIADDVFIGPNVAFTNDRFPRSARSPHAGTKYLNEEWITPILLGEGCSIGAHATIIGPIILGRFCFVGAGTVVTRSIEDYELVVGNPCRRVGWVDETGMKRKSKLAGRNSK